MGASTQLSLPNFGYSSNQPKRVLWKWSFAIAGVLFLFLLWQCGSALRTGPILANKAVQRFHAQLNGAKFEEISREADEGFSQGERHDELMRLLETVHRRLGNTKSESQVNLKVNATTGGTFLAAQYTTQFANGQARETFTWRKTGNTLKLYGYNVQSTALVN